MGYLFTQCEDTLCRTILPLQDTPAIKFTYESSVKVPTGYKVKMSANDTSETNLTNGVSEFNFTCNIPIQSYLIAIAVGDLEVRNFKDSRVSVITEPTFMDEVMTVFAALPEIYDSVAAYVDGNPYTWGRYNLLILPPSFPDGGMENPLLTFASPTIVTADKS
jgi:leukotriene-A4 hydrolase